MKKWLAVFGSACAVFLVAGFAFTNLIMFMKKKTDEDIMKKETADGHDRFDSFQAMEKEEAVILSRHGYEIKGFYIAPHHTANTMIICHGVTVNSFNSLKYMDLFLDLGWNVLVYDHRGHGKSGGRTTSYGYFEKDDLEEAVNWVRHKTGDGGQIGIHGESMGAVTALLYAGGHLDENGADFYIADCPFASFRDQLAYRLKREFRVASVAASAFG